MPWINNSTGLGENAASTTAFFWSNRLIGRDELNYLVRYNGPAKAIVRKPALDATREGWSLLPDLDEELAKQLRRECERLQLQQLAEKTLLFERWYGGGAVIVESLDEQDTRLPFQLGRGIRGFRFAHRYELNRQVTTDGIFWQHAPEAMHAGRLNPVRLYHPSWLFTLSGELLADRDMDAQAGWGDPILQSIYESLSQSGQGSSAVLEYLQRLSVPFIKLQGWAKLLAGNEGAAKAKTLLEDFKKRFTGFRLGVLDGGDEVTQFSATVSGIAELLEHQRADVACAAQMPQTVIYGRSPAGQNSTGKSDLEIYYGWVDATIRVPKLRPLLDWMLRKIISSPCWQCGEISNPLLSTLEPRDTDLQIEFPPLWLPTDAEEQSTRSARANELATYAGMGWIDIEEGRRILQQDGILPDAGEQEQKVEEDLGINSPFITPLDVRKAAAIGYQLWRGQGQDERISSFVPSINAALRRGEEITPQAVADLDAWFTMHPGPYLEGTPEYVELMLRGGEAAKSWAGQLVSGGALAAPTKTDSIILNGVSYSVGWSGYLEGKIWCWFTNGQKNDPGFWLPIDNVPEDLEYQTKREDFPYQLMTFAALKSLAHNGIGNETIGKISEQLSKRQTATVGRDILQTVIATDAIFPLGIGRVQWQDLELVIEVPAGGIREFPDGVRVVYPCAYGYVADSVGLDGEPTDVLVYDLESPNLYAGILWKEDMRQVDEIKLIIGASREEHASALMSLTWGHRNAGKVIKVEPGEQWIVLGKEGKDRRDSWVTQQMR